MYKATVYLTSGSKTEDTFFYEHYSFDETSKMHVFENCQMAYFQMSDNPIRHEWDSKVFNHDHVTYIGFYNP